MGTNELLPIRFRAVWTYNDVTYYSEYVSTVELVEVLNDIHKWSDGKAVVTVETEPASTR